MLSGTHDTNNTQNPSKRAKSDDAISKTGFVLVVLPLMTQLWVKSASGVYLFASGE